MIRFYFNPAPNPLKVALFLEESGLPFEAIPVDTRKGDQHTATFRAINPNGKVPAIVDTDGPGGETRVFNSGAILLYLAEKTGRFLGKPEDRAEVLSWLFFVASGVGPFSGQSIHFQRMAPEPIPFALGRYRRETERHYQVLEDHLATGRDWIAGEHYTIADMAAWGWADRAGVALARPDDAFGAYPHVKAWFERVDARPAAGRARRLGADIQFKTENDAATRRSLYPSSFPIEA